MTWATSFTCKTWTSFQGKRECSVWSVKMEIGQKCNFTLLWTWQWASYVSLATRLRCDVDIINSFIESWTTSCLPLINVCKSIFDGMMHTSIEWRVYWNLFGSGRKYILLVVTLISHRLQYRSAIGLPVGCVCRWQGLFSKTLLL